MDTSFPSLVVQEDGRAHVILTEKYAHRLDELRKADGCTAVIDEFGCPFIIGFTDLSRCNYAMTLLRIPRSLVSRVALSEVCDPDCTIASSPEQDCDCSCKGMHHGADVLRTGYGFKVTMRANERSQGG